MHNAYGRFAICVYRAYQKEHLYPEGVLGPYRHGQAQVPGPISQRVDELITEILWKILYAEITILMVQSGHKKCSNELSILHMPWQLSCHVMCKIEISLEHYF